MEEERRGRGERDSTVKEGGGKEQYLCDRAVRIRPFLMVEMADNDSDGPSDNQLAAVTSQIKLSAGSDA